MAHITGYGFPTSVSVGDLFKSLKDGGLYEFQGGDATDPLNWLLLNGVLAKDPDTSKWGPKQAGAFWHDKSTGKHKKWDGKQIVILG